MTISNDRYSIPKTGCHTLGCLINKGNSSGIIFRCNSVFRNHNWHVFFAGLSKRVIIAAILTLLASLPIVWNLLHDYQRERILTLLDPSTDPLGKGFHTLQALIAIGSGGFSGKGFGGGKR